MLNINTHLDELRFDSRYWQDFLNIKMYLWSYFNARFLIVDVSVPFCNTIKASFLDLSMFRKVASMVALPLVAFL